MRNWRRSTVRVSCRFHQTDVWVEGIAFVMRIREVTDSNLSLYTDYI